MEGTITGSFNELTFLNGLVLAPEEQLQLIEQYGGIEGLGGIHSAPHFAAAWAHAMNTPFKWGKQTASHLGGTRDPMVVAWPNRIAADTALRSQFTHVIDVGPTILEAAGIPEPKTVDGIAQEPMDGTSFLYSFDGPDAAELHTTQYLEMFGVRAMYKDGWWAASRPDRLPWDLSLDTLAQFGPEADWDPDRDVGWELYYLPDDFTQARDIAAEHPEKVEELQELWWSEPIPTGDVNIRMLFEADEPVPGSGGTVTLSADDRRIGEGRLERTVPIAFSTSRGWTSVATTDW